MDITSVAERLLFTTVRIETFDSKNQLCGGGTGFFFSYVVRASKTTKTTWEFIVTNTHVIKSGEKGRLSFLLCDNEGKPKLGEKFDLNFGKEEWKLWYCNNDESLDVAIFPCGDLFNGLAYRGIQISRNSIPNDLILNEESLKEIDALEEVVFIGYPALLWDEKNFLPVFRRGITASPITVDFNGQKKFLIDASVFGGSSGSPVFLFDRGVYTPKSGGMTMGNRLLFLGILSEGIDIPVIETMEKNVEKIKSVTKAKERTIRKPLIEQSFDIGIVFKSSIITSTIEDFFPQFQSWREKLGSDRKIYGR